jgi:hypothetical protein
MDKRQSFALFVFASPAVKLGFGVVILRRKR